MPERHEIEVASEQALYKGGDAFLALVLSIPGCISVENIEMADLEVGSLDERMVLRSPDA